MKISLEEFIRQDIRQLGGYSAHKSPDTVASVPPDRVTKLDANENPYGCSPRVLKALGGYTGFNIYPDAGQTRLRRLLAAYAGVEPSSIIAANGSGELLDYVMDLFLEPGDGVINSVPTFDLYRFRTLLNRGKLVNVTRKDDFAVDVAAIKAAVGRKTKLIVLANPNNPTGNITGQAEIEELAGTGVPLLVDEAYYEFCGETVVPLLDRYPNLMVLRTLSKWAGLAGLRVGYGVFPPTVAAYLMKIKLPYNVSAAAQLAAQESLQDVDYLTANVRAIVAERERLLGRLQSLTWLKPLPSRANFIFCRVLKGDARELSQALLERGILVRYFDQPLVANGVRFSVGKPEQTGMLVRALEEIGG